MEEQYTQTNMPDSVPARPKSWTDMALPASIMIAAVLISGSLFLTRDGGVGDQAQIRNNLPSGGSAPAEIAVAIAGNDHVLGDLNAPVTIFEYSDFQCPFCRRFYTETYSQIKENYIDTGKVKLIYRHLPLTSIHSAALPSAISAECAGEQGSFWQYHDKIFDEQAKQGANTIRYSQEDLDQWAQEIGLDLVAFTSCVESGRHDDKIADHTAFASSNGLTGTPSFIVNTKPIVGALPFSAFQSVIEEELNS